MESKDELKEIDIKNRTCYYFDDIMRAWDVDIDTDFSGVLLDEKLYKEKNKNILIYLQWVKNNCVLGTIK